MRAAICTGNNRLAKKNKKFGVNIIHADRPHTSLAADAKPARPTDVALLTRHGGGVVRAQWTKRRR